MTEEKQEQQESEVQEPTAEPEPIPNMIEEAKQAAERLEAANAKQEELIKRQEALAVKQTLAGKAVTNAEPKKESDADYAERALKGDIRGKKE